MEKEIFVTGIKKFNLRPFGRYRFVLKGKFKSNNVLEFNKLSFNSSLGLELSPEDYEKIMKMFKQHKTDVLVDDYEFYTLFNDNIIKITHPKNEEDLNNHYYKDYKYCQWIPNDGFDPTITRKEK